MDEWLDEVLAILLDMLEKGEDIPDELFAEIADALEELEGVSEPQAPIAAQPQEAQEIPGAPHPSSNINGFRYDPASQKLLVKFMGKDVANAGPVYSYDKVPPYIFDILRRGAIAPKTSGSNKWHTWKEGVTPSHGAAMYALIKAGGFPYRKVA